MIRKGKIVATLGPASNSEKVIKELIETGVNVFRLNFSHGTHEEHAERIKIIRKVSSELNRNIAVLQDICGPKVRIGEIKDFIKLKEGDVLTIQKEHIVGDSENLTTYLSYDEIIDTLSIDDVFYLSDGKLKLKVIENNNGKIRAEVLIGGIISSRKGVNFPNIDLPINVLTQKDIDDIKFGVSQNVDLVAISFVRTKDDVLNAKSIIKEAGGVQPVYSKIEMAQALKNLPSIIDVSDGIMIARGDLGVEVGFFRASSIAERYN